MLTRQQRAPGVLIRDACAADGFHHHIQLRVVDDGFKIMHHQRAERAVREIRISKIYFRATASPKRFSSSAPLVCRISHTGTYGTEAHYCNVNHVAFLSSFSIIPPKFQSG